MHIIYPGDRIVFCLRSCRYLVRNFNTRVVRSVDPTGICYVRFSGYSDFIVYPSEIVRVVVSKREIQGVK